MIIGVFDAVARRRRLILAGAVVVAVAQAAWTARDPLAVIWWVPLALATLLISLTAASFHHPRPAEFVVRTEPPAFVVPPRAGPVLLAVFYLLLFADQAGRRVASTRTGAIEGYDIAFLSVQLLAAALLFAQAWTGYDISLRPDGLYDRRGITGTLVIPWRAQPSAHVARRRTGQVVFPPGVMSAADGGSRPTQVQLTYRHPEVVRTKGLTRSAKRIATEHVDVDFLAAVVNFYAGHPGEHSAIGTEHGYRRLQQALAPR